MRGISSTWNMDIKAQPKMLQKIFEIERDNKKCADCGCHDVLWASYNTGVFICEDCASVHRSLGTHVSDVRRLNERWTDSELLEVRGNRAANAHYEKHVPDWYRKPDHMSPGILREHWIISKYLRKEFTEPNPALDYSSNMTFEVQLSVKNMENNNYKNMIFVISKKYSSLSYYVAEDRRGRPKGVMSLVELEVSLAPYKMNHRNSMQLTYRKSATTRHVYVMSQNSNHVMNLYMAIRCYKYAYLRATLPPWSEHTLASHMPADFSREGWLWKTGPRPSDKYRRRWFSLIKTKLMYHKDAMDAVPRGHLQLSTTSGQICAEVMDTIKIGFYKEVYPFTIRTEERTYCVAAETNIERREWIKLINSVVALPLY